MGYILFLPYTFGLIVSNLLIDLLKAQNKKRASANFGSILNNSEEKVHWLFEKQFLYNQGDRHLLKIFTHVNQNRIEKIKDKN